MGPAYSIERQPLIKLSLGVQVIKRGTRFRVFLEGVFALFCFFGGKVTVGWEPDVGC